MLARAVTQQRFTKADIAELEAARVTSPHAKAQIAAMAGNAYLGLGQPADAKARVEAALALEPANVDARIAQAHVYAADKDFARAGRAIDEVLAANPDNVDALSVKSDVDLALGNSPGATKTLERIVELSPRAMRARYMLASLYVQANEIDKAAAQVDVLSKNSPGEPHTLHAVAMVAFARGDTRAALDAVQKSLEIAPDYLPARYLSGLVDLKRGAYAAAEQSLRTVVAQSPKDDGAAIALAQAQLLRGQTGQAQDSLAPVLSRSPQNVQALRLAAEIELAKRSPAKAADYIARANSLDAGNVSGKVRLAEVRLAKGDTAQGVSDLESLSAQDKDAREPDLALVAAHLRAHDYPKALKAADNIIAKAPKSPVGYNTKGTVYLGMGDAANARAQFEKALAQDGKYVAASYGLAQIDTAERKLDSAKARYQKILETMPQSEIALLGLADLLRIQGAPATEVAAALSLAIAANPDSVTSRLALINYYTQQKDAKLALTAAQAAQAALPDAPALLEALANAQASAGEANQAIDSYVRLTKLQPANPLPPMRLAAIESGRKNFDAAIEYLKTARAIVPDNPLVLIAMAGAYRDGGKVDAGLAEARRLAKENPKNAAGYTLEAELLALDNKPAEAVVAYRAAAARDAGPLIIMRYRDALATLGKNSEAAAVVTQWIAQHPQDVIVRTMMGQRSLEAGDCATAARYFREAVAYDGSNAVLLNNLAWCLAETNDPAALDYAERAYRLAPGHPGVTNTYGWVLVQRGETARGIETMRRAVALDPNESVRRLYLAKALIKSGDKAGARKELEVVASKGGGTQAEAQQLLSGL